jgi:hypothetical protein
MAVSVLVCILTGDFYASAIDYYPISSTGIGTDDRPKSKSGFRPIPKLGGPTGSRNYCHTYFTTGRNNYFISIRLNQAVETERQNSTASERNRGIKVYFDGSTGRRGRDNLISWG